MWKDDVSDTENFVQLYRMKKGLFLYWYDCGCRYTKGKWQHLVAFFFSLQILPSEAFKPEG